MATTRSRAPDDGPPKHVPLVYHEAPDTLRYEIPILIAGVPGTLVIRVFGSSKVEMSARGKAAEMLKRTGGI